MSSSSDEFTDSDLQEVIAAYFESDRGKAVVTKHILEFFESDAGKDVLAAAVAAVQPPPRPKSTSKSPRKAQMYRTLKASSTSTSTPGSKKRKPDDDKVADDQSTIESDAKDSDVEDLDLEDTKVHVTPSRWVRWNFVDEARKAEKATKWPLNTVDTLRDGSKAEKIEKTCDHLLNEMVIWLSIARKQLGLEHNELGPQEKLYLRARLLAHLIFCKHCNYKGESPQFVHHKV